MTPYLKTFKNSKIGCVSQNLTKIIAKYMFVSIKKFIYAWLKWTFLGKNRHFKAKIGCFN
jgi:hypothetical protein